MTARRLGITERQLRRIEQREHRRAPQRRTRLAYQRVFGEDPWANRPELASERAQRGTPAQRRLGQRLRARRLALGLTQTEVGERGRERFVAQMDKYAEEHPDRLYFWSTHGSYLSAATISRWERGLTAGRWESALALALALEIDHAEWFGSRPTAHWMPRTIDYDI